MQNLTIMTLDHNAVDVTQPHPHIVTVTSRHDATETIPEDHGEPEEHEKVHYENPFDDPNYYERFGDEDRNKFAIEHELGFSQM